MRKYAPCFFQSASTVSELIIPAPVWRRLAAALYDALLLLALWMATVLADVILRDLFGLSRNTQVLQILLFLVGLGFFGWFWIHGGQTLGMRAWRLQVRRHDGTPLRWPVAAVRYTCGFVSWGCLGLGIWWCLIDHRRRAWHDLAAGTEVVVLPAKS